MIHFFFGTNSYQLKQALDALILDAREKHGEHAVEKIDGETLEIEQLPDLLQGATLFAPERTVVIRDAGKNKIIWEAVGEKISDLPDSLTLVLVETAPDKRLKTFKTLQKLAEVREFKELNEVEAARWLIDEAGKRGGGMTKADTEILVARAGADQARLSNELDKLLLYGEISAESIEKLVEPTPHANVFALLDAALAKKPEAVRKLLRDAKISEDPYMLFGLLSSQIMQLAALVYAERRSSDEVAKALKTHPYPLKKMAPVAKKTSKKELREIIEILSKMDEQLKSTGADPWQLLENALIKITAR